MSDLCSFLTPILTSIQLFLNQLADAIGFLGYRAPDLLTPLTVLLGCSIT